VLCVSRVFVVGFCVFCVFVCVCVVFLVRVFFRAFLICWFLFLILCFRGEMHRTSFPGWARHQRQVPRFWLRFCLRFWSRLVLATSAVGFLSWFWLVSNSSFSGEICS